MGSKANSYDSPVAIICLYFNFYIDRIKDLSIKKDPR